MTGYHKTSDLPSVTQILSPYSNYDQIPEHRLEAAAARGVAVHAYCAAHAKGAWAPTPPMEYRGYVDSFRQWFDIFECEVLLCEEELEDVQLGYCGHPDLCVRSIRLGGIILSDLKTPLALHRKPWGCQLAAYDQLVKTTKQIRPDRVGSLQLSPDGRAAKFEDFTGNLQEYFRAFFSALVCHKFFSQG